jgi:predicted DNA-binding protein
MPIIKRRPKENLKPISFRLPEPLLERLSAFADFLNVPQAEIVITALNHVMDSDKEFAAASGASPSPSSRPQIAKERCVTWNMCDSLEGTNNEKTRKTARRGSAYTGQFRTLPAHGDKMIGLFF